ncbi:M14 family metallopeptidase [Sulfurospirillum sp. hDNRA2]|uniref:M14 family metallopeptidase n=1 Tax=Sulfurospirillum sp. hDNRA2 TaxID=3237298 RepID=UPI0020B8FCCD|nr:M14 family metallopeptidase [Sulfurospirillum sp. DNRA8]MCP3651623.1 M14 family metallopeptidase [Sulfurospirillum sp. DNRA8]MCR1810470.1 M14 family metallopeptidase [Sulfurospirillum sp. DNRA8]
MREEVLFEISSLSRNPLKVKGYRFGREGTTPSCVIVGPMTGNAIDQLWIASQVVRFLRQQELANAAFIKGEILVIPTVNPYSFNMGKSFWPLDNTDIDVMFPGYDKGETTQRIAARLFEKTNNYDYAILLEARKDHVECIPYVKVLQTGRENIDHARAFGLDFIHLKEPSPSDTVSLNYNWQIWNAQSFSLVSGKKGVLQKNEANKVIDAIIRFLSQKGLIDYATFAASSGNIITQNDIEAIKSTAAGLFDALVPIGECVVHGQPLGRIFNALEGTLMQTIISPCDGIVSCRYDYSMIFQNAIAYRIIKAEAALNRYM